MDKATARRALAMAAQPLMQADRFKYDLAAIEDVLLLVEIGKELGGGDFGAMPVTELAERVRAL